MNKIKFEINDLNYLKAHEELNDSLEKELYTANFLKLFVRWCGVIFYGLILSPFFFYIGYYKRLNVCEIALVSATNNNSRALNPIQEKLGDLSIVFDSTNLPLQRTWVHAMFYSFAVFRNYLTYDGYMKKVYVSEFVSFCRAYGFYIEAKKILKHINPKLLVVANDHIYFPRSFFRAAQALGIKTAYVQHASVTENFPPLEYDYAFLDGQESLDKYTANNKICKSTVFLYGSPRFDFIKSFNIEKTMSNNKCGIAINELDSSDKISELIHRLYQDIEDIQITLRPHPGMDKKYWEIFAKNNNCLFSNSKTENPFQFIAQNDFFISGESSFHLDVAISDKISFYYNFTNKPVIDVYGYLKNGLMEVLPNKLVSMEYYMNNFKNKTKLIQYYVSNFGTSDWGQSATLISSKLEELLNVK